jgi:ABC-type spermidine/putrescine transport system permease subunit I
MTFLPKNKALLLILAAFIVFPVLFTMPLISTEIIHDCAADNCRTCIKIEAAKSFLKTIKLAIVLLPVCFLLSFLASFFLKYSFISNNQTSLVEIKVRLNA